MRVPMVALWLRAGHHDRARQRCAQRYAAGIVVVQLCWIAVLFAPAGWLWRVFIALTLLELSVPAWAERAGATHWHAGHIAERYGLLTLIVLGEAVASLAQGVSAVRDAEGGGFGALHALTVAGGLVILFALWWLYFDRPSEHMLRSLKLAFVWGYGHYLIFAAAAAAAAAMGAGIAVQIEHRGPGWAVAVPVAVYLFVLWALRVFFARCVPRHELLLAPAAVALILLCPLLGAAWSVPGVGVVLVGLLVVKGAMQSVSPARD